MLVLTSNRTPAVFLDVSSMINRAGFVIKTMISSNHFCMGDIIFMVHDIVKMSADCRVVWKSVRIGCVALEK